jgi:flavodoxin
MKALVVYHSGYGNTEKTAKPAAKRWKTTFRTVEIPKPAHSPGEIIDIFRRAVARELADIR